MSARGKHKNSLLDILNQADAPETVAKKARTTTPAPKPAAKHKEIPASNTAEGASSDEEHPSSSPDLAIGMQQMTDMFKQASKQVVDAKKKATEGFCKKIKDERADAEHKIASISTAIFSRLEKVEAEREANDKRAQTQIEEFAMHTTRDVSKTLKTCLKAIEKHKEDCRALQASLSEQIEAIKSDLVADVDQSLAKHKMDVRLTQAEGLSRDVFNALDRALADGVEAG